MRNLVVLSYLPSLATASYVSKTRIKMHLLWNRLIRIVILLGAIGPLTTHATALHSEDGPQLYENTREYVKFLISRFPPKDSIYVGIGRSPTPIIAFLQEYAEHVDADVRAINLPGSLKLWNPSQEKLKRFFPFFKEHIHSFIDHDFFAPGKNIIMLDFTQTGSSLKNITSLMRNFLKSEGYKNRVIPVAILENGASFVVERIEEVYISGVLNYYLINEGFKEFAEYDSLPILDADFTYVRPSGPRPEFLTLREDFREIMKKDTRIRIPFDHDIFEKNPNQKFNNLHNPIPDCEGSLD